MSMTSNPTEKSTSHEAFRLAHKWKTMTGFGAAFNETRAKRLEFIGCPDAHEMSASVAVGSGAPGIEYTKTGDFFGAHRGHALTHLGTMISDKGSLDAWYCQSDDKACYDTKS